MSAPRHISIKNQDILQRILTTKRNSEVENYMDIAMDAAFWLSPGLTMDELISAYSARDYFSSCVESVARHGSAWIKEFIDDFMMTRDVRNSRFLSDDLVDLARATCLDYADYHSFILCERVDGVRKMMEAMELVNVGSEHRWIGDLAGFVVIYSAFKLAKVYDEEREIYGETFNGKENENTQRMHQEQPVHSKAASL